MRAPGLGRHAQAKQKHLPHSREHRPSAGALGRWPEKSCNFLLDLLKNAESNAVMKGLDPEKLIIKHIQVNQAPTLRRRTYRAHGRINPYMCYPCHVEMVLVEEKQVTPRSDAEPSKQIVRKRIPRRAEASTA